jgi:hypothetical protein
VIVTQTTSGSVVAVNAASPGRPDCPVEIAADRLTDCEDRAWTFEGIPIDSADPPLERIAATVTSGSVILDMSQPLVD